MSSLPYPKYRMEEIWEEGKEFGWKEIERIQKEQLKYLIEQAILSELEALIGCSNYERSSERKNYRNGHYERLIATTLGEIPIRFPRLRNGSFESAFIGKYARRRQEVDYAVLSCFVLGGSVRKTKKICELFIDVQISPSTVSKIAKELNKNLRKFHDQKIDKQFRFIILDGLWVKIHDKHKKKRVVLVAVGITDKGEKEIIDFMLADGETEEAYLTFLNHLIKKGLDLNILELVIHDGVKGLKAALDICLPYTKRQYCVFHKIQGIASKLQNKNNRGKIMRDAGNIYSFANNKQEAINLLKIFQRKWIKKESRAVRCFINGFDKTLTYFDFPVSYRPLIKTSNHLERYLREIRRRIRPMGPFKNENSANRIIYSLVYMLNNGDVPFEFTQHS